MDNERLGFALQELSQIEGDLEEMGLVSLAEQTRELMYEIEKEYQRKAN